MTVLLAGVVQHLTPTALCAHWPSKDGGRGLHSAGGFWALVFLISAQGRIDLIFQTQLLLNANLLNVVGFFLFCQCCAVSPVLCSYHQDLTDFFFLAFLFLFTFGFVSDIIQQ